MASFEAEVVALIEAGATRICDVGAGANPVVSPAVVERSELDYVILDAAHEELAKAAPSYDAWAVDVTDPDAVERLVAERGEFDAVVSRWTAEHVPDGFTFHTHIYRLLRPGGTAVHLFPTLYSPVFVANRVLPHSLSAAIVPLVDRSGRERGGTHDCFPPYYSWCRGPTPRQLGRLAQVGFVVRRYVGFFGHPYYDRVKPIRVVHGALSHWLVDHPVPAVTSYGLVVLERDRR
jgi:SAM-dependent methyltransferase